MTEKESKLVIGSLLHDVGKVVFRQSGRQEGHSQSGYEFLREEARIEDRDILDIVRFHHGEPRGQADLAEDSLAYITAIANRIATAADKKGQGGSDEPFAQSMPLQSIFNRLNRNEGDMSYLPGILEGKGDVRYPVKEKTKLDQAFYEKVKDNMIKGLRNCDTSRESIQTLLELLEANLSYVPAITGRETDISLFDHLKLTAALAACILRDMEERGERDYRDRLLVHEKEFYDEKAFLLYSMDVSGIQAFIYTITSKNALKTLRTRSFYLEIMMEHMIDCLLQEIGLSRVNLIYSGGGHCYMLLPATEKTKTAVDSYMDRLNHWLMESFDISLYVAWGYAACSANELGNVPQGSYGQIFQRVGEMTGGRKSHRYSAEDIRRLNSRAYTDVTRECVVCKKLSSVDEEGTCPLCRAIRCFSGNILYDDIFIISRTQGEDALPLPGDYWLTAGGMEDFEKARRQDGSFVRAYSKNRRVGHGAVRLWIGDYTTGKTFADYAAEAEGIERIAIIRADVDNLGQAFVSGFENPKNQNRYVTLSRTAALSRQLSLFFKLHMNEILSKSSYKLQEGGMHPRNVTICYSGGDDLFIVGSWNEVIEMAVDIRRDFERYTQGTLTFSAGIGIYGESYPISAIASEVAELEDASKALPGKNAVTIFPDGRSHTVKSPAGGMISVEDGTYGWREFEQCVIEEKYRQIYRFFQISEERGMNFLYNLLELIRNRGDKINFARYVYILSRLEPDQDADPSQRQAYKEFSGSMYRWFGNETDSRQLKTAIQLYVYLKREKEGKEDVAE